MNRPQTTATRCSRCGSPFAGVCNCVNQRQPRLPLEISRLVGDVTRVAGQPVRPLVLKFSVQLGLRDLMIFITLIAVGLGIANRYPMFGVFLTALVPFSWLRTAAWRGGERRQGRPTDLAAWFAALVESLVWVAVAYVLAFVVSGCLSQVLLLQIQPLVQLEPRIGIVTTAALAIGTFLLVVYSSWPRYNAS